MRLTTTLVLMMALAGCDDTIFGKPVGGEGVGEGVDTSDTGGGAADWCAVQDVFAAACVSCHTAGGGSGDLDLETDPYAAIIGVQSPLYAGTTLVVPGDAAGSLLYRKVAGTQAGGEGSAMPLGSGLDATRTAVIKAWIDVGATSDCSDTGADTATAVTRHHPEGYADPAVHGPDAKNQTEACITCHGDDLTGGDVGVSCDSCHEDGWRTNCTFCHGGTDNTTGAPPRDISGEADIALINFPPHTTHVTTDEFKDGFDCETCHVKPTDVLSAGHVFVGDSTPGVAEVDFSGGLSPAGAWDGLGTCSNLYCHGNGQGDNGTAAVGGSFRSCDACHAWEYSGSAGWTAMSGAHDAHLSLGTGFECGDCHKAVVDFWEPILDTSLHVNGQADIQCVGGVTWDPTTGTCTGSCHDEVHTARSWVSAS